MSPELIDLFKTIMQGTDGALVIVLIYSIRETRAWMRKVDEAMLRIDALSKLVDENTKEIAKVRRMHYALKREMNNAEA